MRNKTTFLIAIDALFLALLLILTFTPLGFIPLGPIKATIVHLPVVFIGFTLGKKQGALAGLAMGFASFINNTLSPGLISFAFTPFVSIAGISGGFPSFIICFLPRILLGFAAGIIGESDKNKVITSILLFLNNLVYSALVLGMIIIFYKQQYALATNISVDIVVATIGTTFCTQSMLEALLASVFIFLIYPFSKQIQNKLKG